MIVDPAEMYKRLIALKKEIAGPKTGVSTGFQELDEFLLLSKRYLMLVTGMGGMGKSEAVDAIALNTSLTDGWKWAFFSPENFPVEEHVKKYVERYTGKGFWMITPKEIEEALEHINEHFTWIDAGMEDNPPSIKELLDMTAEIKATKGLDAYCWDPWNEISHAEQDNKRDDQYIGDQLTKIRRFNRKHDLLGTIVIHPKALPRDKEGNFPVPSLSDCHGGIMWRNKADIGLCFHRHDMTKDQVTAYFQKIKFKFMGKVGAVDLDYEPKSGRFKVTGNEEFLLPHEVPLPF